ncbi:MAG: Uma2 family endonuclease [Ktedonobacteraceae bacterium]|nr:Uma2 family endonuclease [Ktedonobacteraceae bacterium]MBV9019427.1 Uma2 family endonuclease [Ktedonobacteraceae bacterium]
MAERREHDEVAYYYDSHSTEKDLMGEPSFHSRLVHYLMNVLTKLFPAQTCSIHKNLNFYQTSDPNEYPLEPDIAVIKGVPFGRVRSWRVSKTGPAPQVIVEIGAQETWKKDLQEKPMQYMLMGVQEYFAYDPNLRPLTRDGRRLFGWRLDRAGRTMRELPLEPEGRLWSQQLESFLLPDNRYLRLYDSNGQLRLTRDEALAEKLRSLGIDPDQM